MKIQKQRELVIEFERTQIVRKRAKTHLLFCCECRREIDFISLREASTLFGTNAAQLFQFIKTNFCHYETNAGGEIYICLLPLLDCMKAKTNISQMKMIGDS